MKFNFLPAPGGLYDQRPALLDDWTIIFHELNEHQKQEHEKARQEADRAKARSGKGRR